MIILITEKHSVAEEYAKVLKISGKGRGYIYGHSPFFDDDVKITWARGHLCTLAQMEEYDEKYKKWNINDLPFLPEEYKYEVLKDKDVREQFNIIKSLYHENGSPMTIYLAGDSGREGLYIQSLILRLAGCRKDANVKVVWIDSYTEEEIIKGIKTAKPYSEYENKEKAAYMRGIEDFAMGINFTRGYSCKLGYKLNHELNLSKWHSISVGRVMTCVLGLVVEREREIRNFDETPFYKIIANTPEFDAEWKADKSSKYFESPLLYNESGFKNLKDANAFADNLDKDNLLKVLKVARTTETKKAPLLFNLAELQSECSKKYKITPNETLEVAQSLYEKKLITYPRTDARVLSSAVAKEIRKNITGLCSLNFRADVIEYITKNNLDLPIVKSVYTDDSKITDHYALIPTGKTSEVSKLSERELNIYKDIIERFLAIFLPPCKYEKQEVMLGNKENEHFFFSQKVLKEAGWQYVLPSNVKKDNLVDLNENEEISVTFQIKEGKTTPPKRYSSGSMIITMENAGKLIEDEELREQIKGSGIGTSATRGGIIDKLIAKDFLLLNKKTQILTPSKFGERVYDIVKATIPSLLKPDMTASWERGLEQIENGTITYKEYEEKLNAYVRKNVERLKSIRV